MPLQTIQEEVDVLRSKAKRLRDIAAHETPVSPQILEMTEELEERIVILERRLADFRNESRAPRKRTK